MAPCFPNSDQHNHKDFADFCSHETDVLYLHLYLETTGNTSLINFCKEGYEIPCGVDTGAEERGRSDIADEGKGHSLHDSGGSETKSKNKHLMVMAEAAKAKSESTISLHETLKKTELKRSYELPFPT